MCNSFRVENMGTYKVVFGSIFKDLLIRPFKKKKRRKKLSVIID